MTEMKIIARIRTELPEKFGVPRQSAMDLAGELVNQGIKGFWNFSHYDLSVEYPDVTVENVHLGDSLMSLGYRLRNQKK